jgi:peptidyl-prolyl cis-trans isomerase D
LKVIGASFSKQGAGKVLSPIEGSTGVFVVKPESIAAKPNPGGSVDAVRSNLEMQLKSFAERSLESIKKAATIKDYREKF